MIRLLVLAVFVSGLQAQVPGVSSTTTASAVNSSQPPAPAIKPEDKCKITGSVLSAGSDAPLRKADVLLTPLQHADTENPYGATTDGSGQFSIENIDPGQYRLSATRNGFVRGSYGDRGNPHSMGETLTLTNGQTMKNLTIKLVPQGVITGRITDEDGDSLPYVGVQCMLYTWVKGKRQLMASGVAMTNDLGEYRIFDLVPGKYFIKATYQDRYSWQLAPKGKAEEGYAPEYYPNASDASNAAVVPITPGAQIHGIDMTLQKMHTVRVEGHVLSAATGKPVRNAYVMLFSKNNGGYVSMGTSVADASGKFTLHGVVPGSYILNAGRQSMNDRESYRQPLDVGTSNIENMDVSLSSGAAIKGSIIVETPGDIKGSNVRVFLRPKQDNPMGGAASETIQDDGSFTVENVAPNIYDVTVYGLPEGYYVKSIHLGDVDATNGPLDISQGISGGEFKIIVSPNGAQVEGDVHDDKDKAATGVKVVLVPDSDHRTQTSLFNMTATDQNGHFKIKGITPGKYKLFAWESIEPGQYEDPDFLKSAESSGTAIEFEESAHATQALKLLPAPPDE